MQDKSVQPPRRRIFLKQVATVAGMVPLAGATALAAGNAAAAESAPPTLVEHAWRYLNGDESRTLEAVVARIIPADENGPGAKEAGVAGFIDLQLASAWGNGDHFYSHGPFHSGTAQQGYQLAFTPSQVFRVGIAGLDQAARQAHGASFADLAPPQQDALLSDAEHGKLDFGALPSAVFFGALLDATMEGFFGDPIHGGNRDKVGWKLVGFPGVHASYANDIERHNVAWTREPASIADATES